MERGWCQWLSAVTTPIPNLRHARICSDKSGRFCSLMVRTLLEDGKESGRYAFDALSPRVNALADGDEVRSIHGWELPPGHWARALGLQSDWTLGADDVLREEISRAPSRPPRSGYENTPLI